MKAIVWDSSAGVLKYSERPEPEITAAEELKAKVIAAGVCGTDRELASNKGFTPPDNSGHLIVGHEATAQVMEVGPAVTSFKPGDFVTFTIRRGCDECGPCLAGRPDMCATGRYAERGIEKLDGFCAMFAVESESNCVKLPSMMARLGVLCEPFSTVQKALDEAAEASRRLPMSREGVNWFEKRRCLVAGLGPIGLLASMALTLRGAEVWGVDMLDRRSPRPQWLESITGKYIDARKTKPEKASGGKFGFLFQATGSMEAACGLLPLLSSCSVFVFFASGKGKTMIDAGVLTSIIDGNQTLIGSISSTRRHFSMALNDLECAENRWPGLTARLITGEFSPAEFKKAYRGDPSRHIKSVINWSPS